jgi:hypothetical protein
MVGCSGREFTQELLTGTTKVPTVRLRQDQKDLQVMLGREPTTSGCGQRFGRWRRRSARTSIDEGSPCEAAGVGSVFTGSETRADVIRKPRTRPPLLRSSK